MPPSAAQTSSPLSLHPGLAVQAALGALELHDGPALLVDADGEVHLANQEGIAFLQALGHEAPQGLRRFLTAEGNDGSWSVRPLSSSGGPPVFLLARRASAADPLERAVQRWKLSRRQGEILGLIGQGLTNKEIAQRCGCAESTAEIHVSAILRKARVERRAQLIAQLR